MSGTSISKVTSYAIVNEEYKPEVVVRKSVAYGVVNEEYRPEVVVRKSVAYVVTIQNTTSEGNFISFFM